MKEQCGFQEPSQRAFIEVLMRRLEEIDFLLDSLQRDIHVGGKRGNSLITDSRTWEVSQSYVPVGCDSFIRRCSHVMWWANSELKCVGIDKSHD